MPFAVIMSVLYVRQPQTPRAAVVPSYVGGVVGRSDGEPAGAAVGAAGAAEGASGAYDDPRGGAYGDAGGRAGDAGGTYAGPPGS